MKSLVATSFFTRSLKLAMALLFAAALPGESHDALGQSRSADLAIVGISGPPRVVLTPARARAAKQVTVVVENQSTDTIVIPDAATLQNLIDLQVEPLAEIPAPRFVLVPPKKLPITLRPHGKLAVVFRVSLELGDALPGAIGMRFEATLRKAAPDVITAPVTGFASSARVIAPAVPASSREGRVASLTSGPDKGATVTAKPLRVALRKGESESDPITCKVDWPGKSFFVSGWECTPGDGVATPMLAGKQTRTVTVRWGTPGDYVVTAYPTRDLPGGGFEQAHPSELVHVIKVEFKDENGADPDGAKIGITTPSKDRARTFSADVFPSTETQNVTLKVTKGSSTLQIKEITYTQGKITFKAEGTGTTGSKSPGDCRIEAQIEGKPAATADVTVILPQTLLSSVTTTPPGFRNIVVDRHSVPPSPDVPEGWVDLYTFYFVKVRITVGDQFKQPLVSAENDDYIGAEVAEIFPKDPANPGAIRINQQIQADSAYEDPVGQAASADPVPRFPKGGKKATDFVNEPNPIFSLSKDFQVEPVDYIRPKVDIFELKNIIRRVVTQNMGAISVEDQIQ